MIFNLQLYAKEEETLKAVYDSVNTVVGILNSDEEQPAHGRFLERQPACGRFLERQPACGRFLER